MNRSVADLPDPCERTSGSASAATLLAALALAGASCREGPHADRPNVLIVSLDTTCASAVGHLGCPLPTTPVLDALAAEGIAFRRAYAPSTWTAPSHASIFTGRYPSEHGCHAAAGADDRTLPVRESVPTLAGALERAGYATLGITGGPYLDRAFGLGRGFERYDDELGGSERLSPEVTDLALAWIDDHRHRPFFVFVNFFDAHAPYRPDPRIDYPFGDVPRPDPAYDAFSPGPYKRGRIDRPDDADLEVIRERYHQEVFAADRSLGRLLDGLESWGLLESTLVVVVGDHGEAFGERAGGEVIWGHGNAPYENQCHVPLVLRPPGGLANGASVADPVSIAGIPTTVADVVGLPESFPGRSLLAPGAAPELVVAERYTRTNWVSAYRLGEYQLWRLFDFGSGGLFEQLVQFGPDGERRRLPAKRLERAEASRPLLREGREVLHRMRDRVARLHEERPAFSPDLPGSSPDGADVSPALEAKLRALGYIE